jgi:hypothetical protein
MTAREVTKRNTEIYQILVPEVDLFKALCMF